MKLLGNKNRQVFFYVRAGILLGVLIVHLVFLLRFLDEGGVPGIIARLYAEEEASVESNNYIVYWGLWFLVTFAIRKVFKKGFLEKYSKKEKDEMKEKDDIIEAKNIEKV